MALSGTTTFDLTIEEVIEEAYERCGLSVRSGFDLKMARRSMNLLFAEWANRGLNLWTIEQRTRNKYNTSKAAKILLNNQDPATTELEE